MKTVVAKKSFSQCTWFLKIVNIQFWHMQLDDTNILCKAEHCVFYTGQLPEMWVYV
jgi:hypothetical protein